MEDQLNFIQNQLWAVMLLMLIFVIGNIYCYFLKREEKKEKDVLSKLWDQGNIDVLKELSEKILRENPYNFEALYYSAKAMAAERKYEDAIKKYNKIIEIEPGYRSSMQSQIDELTEIINENNSEEASIEDIEK